jgi:hypothetical protein
MTLWTKFTAWLSGWPESTAPKKDAEEEREKPKKKKTTKKKAPKKSKSKGLKQGNMT